MGLTPNKLNVRCQPLKNIKLIHISQMMQKTRRPVTILFKTFIGIILLSGSLYAKTALLNESSFSVGNKLLFRQMLTAVFNTTVHDVQIRSLEGGFSGDALFLVSHANKKIVVRIHHKTKNNKYKQLEYIASKNASDLGIGPKVIYVSDEYDLLATDYIQAEHPNTETMKKYKNIHSLAHSLSKLHKGPKLQNQWSVFEYIKKEIPKARTQKEQKAIAELEKIEAVLKHNKFPNAPCHNDIQPNNLFVLNGKILFIDWGDAGMSDPFWDLARISMEFAFDTEQNSYLLNQYRNKQNAIDKSRFYIMKQVFLLRSAFKLKNTKGGPSKEKQKEIIKIFEANNYPLQIPKDKKVTWYFFYHHAIELFLKNTKTDLYQDSMNILTANYKHPSR